MPSSRPAYLKLLPGGELARRAALAEVHLQRCDLCPCRCHANRLQGELGACATGKRATVFSYGPHFGEEAPLVGTQGSGTIFFSRCNLRCVFCQNWEISQKGEGDEVSASELAAMMLDLQNRGCHNINLVSPSHVVAPILSALVQAATAGLRIPLVYNTGGFDSDEALRLLDGVVDIYMPDMKFADSGVARRYLGVGHYAETNRANLLAMHRQVGDLVLDAKGLAVRGLLVRHLLLPDDLAGTGEILAFLAREVSPHTYLNLMDQYRPCYRAQDYPPLDRRPTRSEYLAALSLAKKLGLYRFAVD